MPVDTLRAIGASNHSQKPRQEDDYYATEPRAAELLLEVEDFGRVVWEPACGGGHLAKVFEAAGHKVTATDLVYRGYGSTKPIDFLHTNISGMNIDVITNPPYKQAEAFVRRALESVAPGRKVAMFLKIQWLEGKGRKKFFIENPPKTVYVSSTRLNCAMNGDFETYTTNGAICYAWYVWEKGYTGDTALKWIN